MAVRVRELALPADAKDGPRALNTPSLPPSAPLEEEHTGHVCPLLAASLPHYLESRFAALN